MPTSNINLGDAFLLETSNIPHLYVAIAPTENNKFLLVNLTKRKQRSEIACILLPDRTGMPSFVKVETVIAYWAARSIDDRQLLIDIRKDSPIPYCCFPNNILLDIQMGAINSDEIDPIHKRAVKRLLNIP